MSCFCFNINFPGLIEIEKMIKDLLPVYIFFVFRIDVLFYDPTKYSFHSVYANIHELNLRPSMRLLGMRTELPASGPKNTVSIICVIDV